MEVSSSTVLVTAVTFALSLFIWPIQLAAAQYLPLNCSQNGTRPSDFPGKDPFIEIEFKLNFECNGSPIFIDQGVRLEVLLHSKSTNNNTDWFPIKYYTTSIAIPSDYISLVELDSSNTSVTAQDKVYKTSLPLEVVKSGINEINKFFLITEYICGQIVQSFTEDIKLRVRWKQRYGKIVTYNPEATWILDDINIRIWNGTSFFQVLNEDFSANDQVIYEFYKIKSTEIQQNQCGLPLDAGRYLYFNGITGQGITSRSLKFNVYSERNIEYFTSELFRHGDSEMTMQNLLNIYGEPLPQEISNIVIDSATDAIKSISSETDAEAGRRALEILDLFGLMGYNSSLGRVSNDFLTFQVIDVMPEDFMNPDERLVVLNESEGVISLPEELISKLFSENITDIRVVTTVFKNLSGILPGDTDDEIIGTRLGSPVLSVTLGCMTTPCLSSDLMLKNPVLIEIPHFDSFSDDVLLGIYFFDLEKNAWSSRGCNCNSELSNSSFSVCECDHLTHFAILLSSGVDDICPSCINSEAFDYALQFITYTGVALSIIGLIITLITLLLFKKLRDRDVTKFHIQLSLAMLFMLIVFIAGTDKIEKLEGCIVASVLIHYFTLTSILWMLAEALLLFQKVVFVFKPVTKKMIIISSLVLWVTPIFPVAISLIMDLSNGSEPSTDLIINRDKYCFPSNPIVYWLAFMAPIFAVILVNSVIFIMVIVILVRQTRRRLSREKKSVDSKTIVRLIISLTGIMFLFGIPWLFAAPTITVKQFHKPGQAIFTVFLSLQGFFMFVFFCINIKDARESWRTLLKINIRNNI